jgi:hypothetical protein
MAPVVFIGVAAAGTDGALAKFVTNADPETAAAVILRCGMPITTVFYRYTMRNTVPPPDEVIRS